MSRRWLDASSDGEAADSAASFWSALRGDFDAGAFWADRIKQYRDEPAKRLQLAMDNLPLPAAFREAAIALRAIIRARRSGGESYEEPLGLLYWLAAIDSFTLPYAERLKEPGFNVIESIPGEKLRSLPIEYRQLGHEELALLNQTDRNWMVEAWGEPAAHTTLNQIYRLLWDEYEEKLVQKRQDEQDASWRELRESARGRAADQHETPMHAKRGCMVGVALGLAAIAFILLATLVGEQIA